MEEDIKILEEFKTKGYTMLLMKYGDRNTTNFKLERAIENLIKGYRELEEKNKYWNDRIEYAKKDTKGLKMYEMGIAWEDMKEDLENSIPKSKIKEKIEEQYELFNTPNRQKEYSQEVVEVLQELMEDK